jgi:hypothetical protein
MDIATATPAAGSNHLVGSKLVPDVKVEAAVTTRPLFGLMTACPAW